MHAGALYRVLRAAWPAWASLPRTKGGTLQPDPAGRAPAHGRARFAACLRHYARRTRALAGVGRCSSVRTGQPAFDQVFGIPLFQYFPAHPEAAQIFDDAMTSRSGQENTAIVAAYDFAAAHTVVDVGGGQGTLLAAILEVHPHARGVLFDLPHVIAPARTRIEHAS